MGPVALLALYYSATFHLTVPMSLSDPSLLEAARVASWESRYDESVLLYERYVKGLSQAGQSDETAVIEWALVLGWNGKPVAGVALLEERTAGSAPALAAAGDLHRWSGNIESAERNYRAALERDANQKRALEGMSVLTESVDYKVLVAKRSLAAAQTDDPGTGEWAHADYVEALVDAKRYYEARQHADSLLSTGAADPERRIRNARKEAERGARAWLSSETARRRQLWHETRDAEHARASETGAASTSASAAELDSTELAYADILVSRGKNHAAFDRYRAVQRRSPRDTRPANRVADLYRWEGRRDWAKRATLRSGFDWRESEHPRAATPVFRQTHDSESFRASALAIDLAQEFDGAWKAGAHYEQLRMQQNDLSTTIDRIGARGSYLWRDGVSIHGTYRLNAYRHAGATQEAEARIEYLRGLRWRFDAAAERFDVPERALSLRAVGDDPLHGTAYRASLQWMPDGPVRAGSSVRRTSLADQNSSFDSSWKLSYSLHDSPRIAVEYRGSYLSYTEESDLYWSPVEHRSHKGGVHVSLWRETMSLECEAFFGRSTEISTGTAADIAASFSRMFTDRIALDTGFFHSRVFRSDGAYVMTAWRAGLTVGH